MVSKRLGATYLLPALSSAGVSLVSPCVRFHTPLIETGRAERPHPALGERITMSPTGHYWSVW
jgi:hypothetical protein